MRHTNGNMGFVIPFKDLDEPVKSERRKTKFGQVQKFNEETESFDDVQNPTNQEWLDDAIRKGKIVKNPNIKKANGEKFYVIPFDLSTLTGEIEDWKADGIERPTPEFFIGSIQEVTEGVTEGTYAFSWVNQEEL